ncbi:hypothetical protein EVJ58_g8442 [Rhodofomes roseus]|uniref:3'(2'),5'-bisphosphate nucleotidase n=1 Tax=Rhodofomes roseus TaxID=34475 RepID=A0A4Y9XYD9_9APHY|nr:hypothetical protein EVJ58_g8442 [Rhodofomes roseus]
MSLTYSAERQVAVAAVRRACALTSSVFNKLVRNETHTKDDKSPVTVGDFAAQAVVNTILSRTFPHDPVVGEEDSNDLRADTGVSLRERVVALANESLTAPLQPGEDESWGVGPTQQRTTEDLLAAIDRGNYEGGRSGPPTGTRGAIFVATRGHGVFQLPLAPAVSLATDERGERLRIPAFTPETLNLLESVEKAHAKLSFNEKVARLLGVTRPPTRMDSQAKYAALARGDGGVYLRMPVGTGYKEKIWDHAPGSVLVEEAGGIVSDSRGRPLDFGLGRTLGENFGVVAAGKEVHAKVIEAIQRAKEEEAKEEGQ